jgi:hypothetical protein
MPLRNATFDAEDIAVRLEKVYGWTRQNGAEVRLCVNERATAAAIRERLTWLSKADRRFLFQSGHGTQAAARNRMEELDGLDEIFCAQNFDWIDESTWLRDDDYEAALIQGPEGAQTIFISDSCHSGDLARDAYAPRYYPPPVDIEWRNRQAREAGLPRRRLASMPQTIAISACRGDQTCQDGSPLSGRGNGAFTGAFKSLIDIDADMLLREMVNGVNTYLGRMGYDQVAQFDAPASLRDARIWRP